MVIRELEMEWGGVGWGRGEINDLASIFWADFNRSNYKEFYSGFIAITADFDKQNKRFLILEKPKTFTLILFNRPQREIFKTI